LLSGNFRLKPKFRLSGITSPFGLTLYLDQTLAQQKVQSKSEVIKCVADYTVSLLSFTQDDQTGRQTSPMTSVPDPQLTNVCLRQRQ